MTLLDTSTDRRIARVLAAKAPPRLSALELHRRWSALEDERAALEGEIDERQCQAGLKEPRIVELDLFGRSAESIDQAPDHLFRSSSPDAIGKRKAELKATLAEMQAHHAAERKRLGLDELDARLEALRLEIDRHVEMIFATPVESAADIAIRLDVALSHELGAPDEDDQPHVLELMRAIRRLAPEVELTALKRDLLPEARARLLALLAA